MYVYCIKVIVYSSAKIFSVNLSVYSATEIYI